MCSATFQSWKLAGILEWQEKAGKFFRDCRKPLKCYIAFKNGVTKIETCFWESCLAETHLSTIYYSKSQPLTVEITYFHIFFHKNLVHPCASLWENWLPITTAVFAHHLRSWVSTQCQFFVLLSVLFFTT